MVELREGFSPPKVHLSVISDRGGLGDMIARIPAFRFMHKQYTHVSMDIYWHDYFVELAHVLLPETDRLKHKKLSEAPYNMQAPVIEFNTERLTTLHLHLTDHAFLILMDQLPPSVEDKEYPKPAPLPLPEHMGLGPEVVVFTTDYTAPSRQWPAVHINTLAAKLNALGLSPVLLGRSKPIPTGEAAGDILPRQSEDIDKSLFIDLRDKTTLVEALGIMQRAKAVVGVDNGLLHLAHCTDTPIVCGFTTLEPRHRLPERPQGRTLAITPSVPCGGCQSKGFAINTDWRTCIFDDYVCTLTLTADRYLAALKNLEVLP